MAAALMAECGLKHRSRLAYPALLIGANLPDVDILSYVFYDELTALAFRRGWTHGVLAMLVLPVVLATVLIVWSRARRQRQTVEFRASIAPVRYLPLLGVSAIAVVSHPLLDLLNNYGVRLLMPFSARWYYGDAIFIVDPWILAFVIGGTWLARRRMREGRPSIPVARAALAGALVYIAAMIYISQDAARLVAREAGLAPPVSPRTLMLDPDPLLATTRRGLLDIGGAYEQWQVDWRPGGARVQRMLPSIPTGTDDPCAAAARATSDGKRYLSWARFPFFVCGVDGDPALVHLGDARYSVGPAPAWSTVRVRVQLPGG